MAALGDLPAGRAREGLIRGSRVRGLKRRVAMGRGSPEQEKTGDGGSQEEGEPGGEEGQRGREVASKRVRKEKR